MRGDPMLLKLLLDAGGAQLDNGGIDVDMGNTTGEGLGSG